jgi:heterotetrameric sarcosine oxidase delta subunit
MLRIPCPCCGERNHDEFRYGGDATLERPSVDETDPEPWYAYVYIRHNPQELHREYWQHVMGCRQWLVVERDTLTHRIGEARLARRGEPE